MLIAPGCDHIVIARDRCCGCFKRRMHEACAHADSPRLQSHCRCSRPLLQLFLAPYFAQPTPFNAHPARILMQMALLSMAIFGF